VFDYYSSWFRSEEVAVEIEVQAERSYADGRG
jgi:GntR family transcriptional regulator